MALNLSFIKDEIIDQYLNDSNERPWIVGFSGGKDSTMLLQLVWSAIGTLPEWQRKRHIYLICNDTLVENPKIAQSIHATLKKIETAAVRQSMPLTVHQTTPRLEDSFWVNLLGRGYPAPNNTFRWCTDRLKINPTTEFIKSKISEVGEAIILLGTRSDESNSRARSIEKTKIHIEGERLRKHVLPNAYVFAPIKDVLVDELWQYLLQNNPMWGGTNRDLITLYSKASGGDCPLVIDTTTQSCGKSRFGCWVCTVVKRDKSMEALVDNGEEWMEPLIEFRDLMADNRNNPEWRESRRRNGMEGEGILGPYKPKYRALMLESLLKAQKEVQAEESKTILINYQELVAIQVLWHRDAVFNNSVAEIYNRINGTNLQSMDFDDRDVFEKQMLKDACEDDADFNLIGELLEIQKSKYIMVNNYGLQSDLENHIERYTKQAM